MPPLPEIFKVGDEVVVSLQMLMSYLDGEAKLPLAEFTFGRVFQIIAVQSSEGLDYSVGASKISPPHPQEVSVSVKDQPLGLPGYRRIKPIWISGHWFVHREPTWRTAYRKWWAIIVRNFDCFALGYFQSQYLNPALS